MIFKKIKNKILLLHDISGFLCFVSDYSNDATLGCITILHRENISSYPLNILCAVFHISYI